ncbi:MAG: adaptor protein MecA, partial [Anaerostipes sp.]|nr:adaptor protein MecA [Anaerostipes sp.]
MIMKIERISDNQIRCTLNKEDLEGKETLLSELAFGSEKAKGLFRELMNKAATELGFETSEDNPLMVEAIPVSKECLILVITRVDNP